MLAPIGVVLLVVFVYLKPQEFIPVLTAVPLLYIFLVLAVFGLALDIRGKFSHLEKGPHFNFVLAFFGWALLTAGAMTGGTNMVGPVVQLSIALVLFFVLAFGVQTFRMFEMLLASIIALSLFVGFIGFHQGFAPMICAARQGSDQGDNKPDGRPCTRPEDCYTGDAEPGAQYECERSGLLGTMSVGGGRVRYRGVLRDPNELALATGVAVPLMIGRVERKASMMRILTLIVGGLMIATTIIFTQSRGGQLIFLAALGAYFIRKLGAKGVVLGAIAALPILALGGRSDSGADDSTLERLDNLKQGLIMMEKSPLFGVGFAQFTAHHPLTAHNSYVLCLAEMGPIGLYLFLGILYISLKVPLTALRRYPGRIDATPATVWSMSLLASFIGLYIGIFFLSFSYHHILWIYFGLTASLYSCIRRHDKEFKVQLGFYEYVGIGGVVMALYVILSIYLKIKLG